ncbi:DUF6059 family protein [Streptomyces jeddahensis]|uniref:Uncharacterized protein n=1 Tax=Streptomyces jeddahensis TaxID=1716141 RepID=A0A177HKZ2_9ACTN|nr:DUF6059 family protein [Streptomyces jeddahensis]OAH10894.1 hypothetical protein STSP_57360 [Streptomyces jeddahensis]
MAIRGARRMRRFTRALAAHVWQCLVAAGSVQVAGEAARADARLLDAPPPGHPERLRPDLPLSALERALLKELDPAG